MVVVIGIRGCACSFHSVQWIVWIQVDVTKSIFYCNGIFENPSSGAGLVLRLELIWIGWSGIHLCFLIANTFGSDDYFPIYWTIDNA